ncbi:unnamed protein product [Aphanomyces euteiches]
MRRSRRIHTRTVENSYQQDYASATADNSDDNSYAQVSRRKATPERKKTTQRANGDESSTPSKTRSKTTPQGKIATPRTDDESSSTQAWKRSKAKESPRRRSSQSQANTINLTDDNDDETHADSSKTFAMGNRLATDYFSSRKIRKKAKDDKKTSALSLLDADDIRAALKAWDAKQKNTLVSHQLGLYSKEFDRWEHQLRAGFNLLFTGFGSKIQLLQSFASCISGDIPVLQIHGYLPSASIRLIVVTLFQKMFKSRPPPNRSLEEQCLTLALDVVAANASLCLVIHSIDGAALRGTETQRALSILAASRNIHVVASIDHINATSLWEESETKRFGWLEHVVHTAAPYAQEAMIQGWSGGGSGKSTMALSGLKYILESLTPTDLAVLRALGTEQLKGTLVEHKPFVDLCRKRMIVNSVQGMRNALTCLTEHELVIRNSATDHLRIPFGDHVIQQTILSQNTQENAAQDKSDDENANEEAEDDIEDD